MSTQNLMFYEVEIAYRREVALETARRAGAGRRARRAARAAAREAARVVALPPARDTAGGGLPTRATA